MGLSITPKGKGPQENVLFMEILEIVQSLKCRPGKRSRGFLAAVFTGACSLLSYAYLQTLSSTLQNLHFIGNLSKETQRLEDTRAKFS